MVGQTWMPAISGTCNAHPRPVLGDWRLPCPYYATALAQGSHVYAIGTYQGPCGPSAIRVGIAVAEHSVRFRYSWVHVGCIWILLRYSVLCDGETQRSRLIQICMNLTLLKCHFLKKCKCFIWGGRVKNLPRAAPVKYTFYPSLSPLYLHFYLPSILPSFHSSILPSFHPSILPSFHPSILQPLHSSVLTSISPCLSRPKITQMLLHDTLFHCIGTAHQAMSRLRLFCSILSVLTIVSTGITPLVSFTGMTGARSTSPLPAAAGRKYRQNAPHQAVFQCRMCLETKHIAHSHICIKKKITKGFEHFFRSVTVATAALSATCVALLRRNISSTGGRLDTTSPWSASWSPVWCWALPSASHGLSPRPVVWRRWPYRPNLSPLSNPYLSPLSSPFLPSLSSQDPSSLSSQDPSSLSRQNLSPLTSPNLAPPYHHWTLSWQMKDR